MRRFAFVAGSAFGCVSLAYAASVNGTVDPNPAMCSDFARMVGAASIATKSDDDLCDLRFSALPIENQKGFVFPGWRPVNVDDVAKEAGRIHRANSIEKGSGNSLLARNYDATTQAAVAENNLGLFRTKLPLEAGGEVMSVEMMDVKGCSHTTFQEVRGKGEPVNTEYMAYDAYPSFAMYADNAYSKSFPVSPEIRGGQLATWNGEKLVQIHMPNHWLHVNDSPTLTVTLLAFMHLYARTAAGGRLSDKIISYEVCEIDITKKS
jgi:hypothetical protein